jgi:hypothetical protein
VPGGRKQVLHIHAKSITRGSCEVVAHRLMQGAQRFRATGFDEHGVQRLPDLF